MLMVCNCCDATTLPVIDLSFAKGTTEVELHFTVPQGKEERRIKKITLI